MVIVKLIYEPGGKDETIIWRKIETSATESPQQVEPEISDKQVPAPD